MTTERTLLLGAAWGLCAAAPLLAMAAPAGTTPSADERALLARLKKLYPATGFSRVNKSPVKGLYEVAMGENIAYVDAAGRHFFFGHLFDMQLQTDLTAQRQVRGDAPSAGPQAGRAATSPAKLVKLSELPLQDAIKQVNGTGARTLVVFSDPLCPYCKRLEVELPQLANTTVYTFLIPILGAGSRQAAETRWAASVPERSEDLEVLDRNLQLAQRQGIQVTPTLVRGDGTVTAGAMAPAELDAWLNGAGPVASAPTR